MIEDIACEVHASWSHWMVYLFLCGDHNPDGSFTIEPDCVERWQRQLGTEYGDLSESEKESDRKEALRYLTVMREME